MPGKKDVEKLLSNLNRSANPSDKETTFKDRVEAYKKYCASMNLDHYKTNHAWPGRKYVLVGNSYAVDRKIRDTKYETRRTACIAMIIERGKGNRHCLSVEDALGYPGFVESLSRFEFDWLRRQPPSTLIGPAYSSNGDLIPNSFAVWKREVEYTKSTSTKRKKRQLAGATA